MGELTAVQEFLACQTPAAWLDQAAQQLSLLLIDHAHCEKKAASTALTLMFRYVDKPQLLHRLSRLAREELRHFEKVLVILQQRGIAYKHLPPARYADGLRQHARHHEPARLIDLLIIGAFIEARSCERFAALLPLLDAELAQFYRSLLKAEARHFQNYLQLANTFTSEPLESRIAFFRGIEAELITTPDPDFRFHSGIPQ